jgi:hypothetical protein
MNRGGDAGGLDALLSELAQFPASPATGWHRFLPGEQTVAEIRTNGWRYKDHEPIVPTAIDDWTKYAEADRSWGLWLQSWAFMDVFFDEFDTTSNLESLSYLAGVVDSWLENEHSDRAASSMAYYDMSLALRVPRLIALLTRTAGHEPLIEESRGLLALLLEHQDRLHDPSAFAPHTNHGFYTAAAQLHIGTYVSELPGAERSAHEGQQRMSRMLKSQFADDGGHLEHSPGYHSLVLDSLEDLVRQGLVKDPNARSMIAKASRVLGWMVQPDGCLAQFGDTPAIDVMTARRRPVDDETAFVFSDGGQGVPGKDELLVLPHSGYAFVRSPQPGVEGALSKSSYLALSAGFHSRAHKHCDDLSIIWYDRGAEILVDGGKYGYGELLAADSPLRAEGFYYKSPARQYVESTIAHNTLMIDGKNHDRRRTPFGSGIGECWHRDSVFALTARAQHRDYAHRRRIRLVPGRKLELIDSVFSGTDEERVGVSWFNLNASFELVSAGDDNLEFTLPQLGIRLRVSSSGALVKPVRGHLEPMRGWRSRNDGELVPTWSFGFQFTMVKRHALRTAFELSGPR